MKSNIEMMFPVAIVVTDVDPQLRDAVHAKVMAYIASEAAKRDVLPSPIEAVETSYFTGKSVIEEAGLQDLERQILTVGTDYIRWLGVNPPTLEMEKSWINIFRPKMQETEHSHDGSILSATYYVEAPENCGNLVFQDPITARRSHRAFTKTNGPAMQSATEIKYEPKPGRFLLWESWLPHAVSGNKSDKTRISLAFNMRIKTPATTLR